MRARRLKEPRGSTPVEEVPFGANIGATDLRFRTLIGEAAWTQLPPQVQQRFSKFVGPSTLVVYRGEVLKTELSWLGLILALLARAIGGPLPLTNGATGEARVEVGGDRQGGQIWTRIYSRPGLPPQIVRSSKRFRGPTGLEEYVGGGIGMALSLSVEDGALVFRSEHYFLEAGSLRLRIPRLLSPGRMEIVHRDEAPDRFSFRLTLTHPVFGRLLHQLALFRDPRP